MSRLPNARVELLTAAREAELARAYASGDAAAGHAIIAPHMRRAVAMARRFSPSGRDVDDLTQHALIGMIVALDRFDPDRGLRFITYAHGWMFSEVQRAVPRHQRTVHCPDEANRTAGIVARAYRRHRPSTPEALAEICGVRVERVRDLWPALVTSPSLDVSNGVSTALERTAAPEEPERDVILRRALDAALGALDVRSRDIVQRHLLDDEALEAIGRDYGITRQAAHQIESIALVKLRKRLQHVYTEAA